MISFTSYSTWLSVANLTACGGNPGGPYLFYAQGATGTACANGQNFTTVGISLNEPTGYSNTANSDFVLVQLISSDSLTGGTGLDSAYPYGLGVIPSDDSPGRYLGTSAGTVSRDFTAYMFLMWRVGFVVRAVSR